MRAIATTAAKIVIGIKVVLIIATLSTPESSGALSGALPAANARSNEDAGGCPSDPACSRENSADI